MVEIVPSINAPTFEEAQARIEKAESYVSWCHLDVTDGIFSKHLTWHNPLDLPRLQTTLNAEVHLMVEKPEEVIDQWLVEPVKRAIVHLEASRDIPFIIDQCRNAGREIGLAIRPDTFWGKLQPWFGKVDLFLVLGVNPGPSGQKMAEDTLDKIQHIRAECPDCGIEVDGGVNFETAPSAAQAGADILVAGSVIFSHTNIGEAVQRLNTL